MNCETKICGKNSKCFLTITGVQRQILYDKIIGKKISWSLSPIVRTLGIVLGAVFGSVAALAVAGILVWWTCRPKKRPNTKGTEGKCCTHLLLSNEHWFWHPRNISLMYFLSSKSKYNLQFTIRRIMIFAEAISIFSTDNSYNNVL